MSDEFTFDAQPRESRGKAATRRLRREGLVPAVMYGAGQGPTALALQYKVVKQALSQEAFFSQILTVKVNGKSERAIVRALQRDPAKALVTHMDLQRVSEDVEIRVAVPIHFLGEEAAPGVKQDQGVMSRLLTEVEVSCLPRHLPEYIELDCSELGLNESRHLSDLPQPEGVTFTELAQGPEHDYAVVSILPPRMEEPEEEIEEGVELEAGEADESEEDAERAGGQSGGGPGES